MSDVIDYHARARALRAKFFPAQAPVVVKRTVPQPRIVEITRPTFDSVRRPCAIIVPGRVYGPFPLPRDFLYLSRYGFEFARSPTRVRVAEIKREVAQRHGILVGDIDGRSRLKKITDARHEAIAAVYVEFPKLSLPEIARLFNMKDHTTALYVVKKLGVWRGASS